MLINLRNALMAGGSEPAYWGLCFEAKEAGAVVNMVKRDSPPAVELKYSTDGTNWHTFDADGGTTPVTLANAGDKVYFKAGDNGNTAFALAGNSATVNVSNQSRSFTFSKQVSASGNIMSLLNGSEQSDTIGTQYAFRCLFRDCSSLVSPPILPATTLSVGCYVNMFSGCSSLTAMPILPAITITGSCYREMFYNCTSLVDVCDLPASKVISMSYQRMFSNCSALTKAPKLMFTAAAVIGAYDMFSGCSVLSEIEVRMTSWSSLAFQNWVKDVAATGTFKCPAALGTDETITRGVSNCPSGWTVVNI